MYSLDYHLIPAHSKQEMELSPCANSRSSTLPFNLCQLFLVLGPGNNWPIPVLSDWLRPVLSDWINPAMGVPPRADKPGKPLETVGMGITLSYKPSTSCTSTHTNSCPWYFSTAGKGHGTPIQQGVNCSENLCAERGQSGCRYWATVQVYSKNICIPIGWLHCTSQ